MFDKCNSLIRQRQYLKLCKGTYYTKREIVIYVLYQCYFIFENNQHFQYSNCMYLQIVVRILDYNYDLKLETFITENIQTQ